ncbi:MAG: hypothetical protein P4M08_06320 [Oligoflexia bacterium]|nr:hypothetical protein [Oligoflexia bacterium]
MWLNFAFGTAGLGAIALAAVSSSSWAYEYQGRLITGAYLSQERFSESGLMGTSNDFATASFRFFLDVSKFRNDWEAIADVRDKYGFFDAFNKPMLDLTGANTLQARQLSLSIPEKNVGFYGNFGRFPVTNAGAIYTDGAELGYRLNPNWSVSAFGGLNPKRDDQYYVQYNPGCVDYGAYLLYQPKFSSWTKSFYFTNSFVTEDNFGHVDRRFWFENLVYEPDPADRFMTVSYLDFVPNPYIQDANLNYSHDFNPKFTLNTGLSTINAIEYYRQEGVLEQLGPSAYTEASVRGQYRLTPVDSLNLLADYGTRQADGTIRREIQLTANLNQLGGDRRFAAYFGSGLRHEFVSNDVLAKFGGGYYTDKWELTLNTTVAYQKYTSGNVLTPIYGDFGTAFYFNKSLYGTVSFQEAVDQDVKIFSTYLNIGYRFGTKSAAPIRNGAPPAEKI